MSYDLLILHRNIVKTCKELQFPGGSSEFVQTRRCKPTAKPDWEKEREMIDVQNRISKKFAVQTITDVVTYTCTIVYRIGDFWGGWMQARF